MAENGGKRNGSRPKKSKSDSKKYGNSPKKELLKRHLEYNENAKQTAKNRFDITPFQLESQWILQSQKITNLIGKTSLCH